MMKKYRKDIIIARPRTRTPKVGSFEGVRNGVATSGTPGPEIKNFDINVANTAVVTGTPYILSQTAAIAEGTAGNNRVGIKILIKSFDLQLDVAPMVNGGVAGTQGLIPCYVDVYIVWDKQPDGATPAVATIFSQSTTPLTFGNVGQLDRFVVLRRRRFTIDGASGLGYTMTEHVPLNLATRFADATTNPNTNDIYVVSICNTAASALQYNAGISYSARVKFVDA
jgi:hypothetical protein